MHSAWRRSTLYRLCHRYHSSCHYCCCSSMIWIFDFSAFVVDQSCSKCCSAQTASFLGFRTLHVLFWHLADCSPTAAGSELFGFEASTVGWKTVAVCFWFAANSASCWTLSFDPFGIWRSVVGLHDIMRAGLFHVWPCQCRFMYGFIYCIFKSAGLHSSQHNII